MAITKAMMSLAMCLLCLVAAQGESSVEPPTIKGVALGMPLREVAGRLEGKYEKEKYPCSFGDTGYIIRLQRILKEDLEQEGTSGWDYTIEMMLGLTGHNTVLFDHKQRLTRFRLNGPLLAEMFDAKDIDADVFVREFAKAYNIPHFRLRQSSKPNPEFQTYLEHFGTAMGDPFITVRTWTYLGEGWQISLEAEDNRVVEMDYKAVSAGAFD